MRVHLVALLVGASCAVPQAEVAPAHEADRCIVVACDGEIGECGIFLCSDIEASDTAAVEPAQFRPPPTRRPPSRSWRHTGIRDGVRPRVRVPYFAYRFGYLPAFPQLEGKVVRHHLFPQAEEFAEFFRIHKVDVHKYTMLVPEPIHLRIHAGSRGGPWNAAWREYRRVNADRHEIPQEELLRQAIDLSFRFRLAGPIVPYRGSLVPPAVPQLFANPPEGRE